MTVTDMSRRYRGAFLDAVGTAVADLDGSVLVVAGHPGTKQPADIVALLDVQVDQTVATMSTNRSRECAMRLTVRVSIYRTGGPEVQQIAEDRAYDVLNAVEEYVRVTDTTLGGVVRWCFCTSHSFDPLADLDVSQGRLVEIDAVFTAAGRITS